MWQKTKYAKLPRAKIACKIHRKGEKKKEGKHVDLPTHLSLWVLLPSPTSTTSGRKCTSQSPPVARSTMRGPLAVLMVPPRSGPPTSRTLSRSLSGPVCRRFIWFWQRPFKARVRHSSPEDADITNAFWGITWECVAVVKLKFSLELGRSKSTLDSGSLKILFLFFSCLWLLYFLLSPPFCSCQIFLSFLPPHSRASFPLEVKRALKKVFALKDFGPKSSRAQHGAQWRVCVRMNN